MGRAFLSSVPPCGNVMLLSYPELSGVVLLPAWLQSRIFPAPSFPFSCKEQGKTQAPA